MAAAFSPRPSASNGCTGRAWTRAGTEGFTGQYAGKITEREAHAVLRGALPDGAEIPVYPFAEFKRGVADLPLRYGVVLDFELARKSKRGYETFEVLKDEPNMIARAGGVEANAAYLDKFQARHGTKLMGNWHPYNRIDPDQPQTRIIFLAGNRGGVFSEGDRRGGMGLRLRIRHGRRRLHPQHGPLHRRGAPQPINQLAAFGFRPVETSWIPQMALL